MEDKKKEIDLLWELEIAESSLQENIQALAYIEDDLETTKLNEIKFMIPEIKNKLRLLLKSMMYDRQNIQNVINQANK